MAFTGMLLAAAALGSAGCNIVGAIGAMEESRRRNSTREIKAEYAGLEGKSFAVVVSADQVIQASFPETSPRLTTNIADRLREHAGATGFIPGEQVVQFQFNRPRWVTLSPSQLAAELNGVQRLIIIELIEYRLNDPGNAALWDGRAAANVRVYETDTRLPDTPAYTKAIRVKFPDNPMGPDQLAAAAINTILARRLTDRISWLFYDHEEPYYPDY